VTNGGDFENVPKPPCHKLIVKSFLGIPIGALAKRIQGTTVKGKHNAKLVSIRCGVGRSASVIPVRTPPLQTVRADFPHTASLVKLVSLVSFPYPFRSSFALIPTDTPRSSRAVSDAPPQGGLSPLVGLSTITFFSTFDSYRFILQVEVLRSAVITHFIATTTSSDSYGRFRAAGLPSSRCNFPDAPPLYAPPCFLRRKSTPTLLFGFTQNDTLAAWGFNYNEA